MEVAPLSADLQETGWRDLFLPSVKTAMSAVMDVTGEIRNLKRKE